MAEEHKKQSKGTKGYVAEINKMLRQEFGEVPTKLTALVRKTAHDMLILDKITDQLEEMDEFVEIEVGSMGQQKTVVTPLIAYYDKASSRVTDDLYNLGLTARKQAAKAADPTDPSTDRMNEFIEATQG